MEPQADQNEITAKLDTNQLVDGWALKKGLTPKLTLTVKLGARTDLGMARENNEDKFEFFEPEEPELLAVKGSLYAVADGMGGHASGQVASDIALRTIVKTFYADTSDDVLASLKTSLQTANSFIYDTAQMVADRAGMGTTCTAAVLRDDDLFIAHVGDSRLYLVRGGTLYQVTDDHSWVAEQVRLGALTEQEALKSPFKNVITRSLGASPEVQVDTYQEKIEVGDVLILCSDGLSGGVSSKDILDIALNSSPSMAAMKLVDRANEVGGGDNITVMVVAIREIRKPKAGSPFKKLLHRD